MEVACVVDEPVELHPFAFRVHTHRHGTNVGGWLVQEDPVSGEDHWTLLGQRDPQVFILINLILKIKKNIFKMQKLNISEIVFHQNEMFQKLCFCNLKHFRNCIFAI